MAPPSEPVVAVTADAVAVPVVAEQVAVDAVETEASAAELAAVVAQWAAATVVDGSTEAGPTEAVAGVVDQPTVAASAASEAADTDEFAAVVAESEGGNSDAGATESGAAESGEVAAESVESGVDASGTTAAPQVSGVLLPGDVASDAETIVHVMRHGEVHNPKGILYGRLPGFQLSVTGRAQAQAVARSLADHDIALVVASPLQRAQETAEPIAAHHGLIIRTDDNLIEAGNTFEGLRVSMSDGALFKPRHWWKMRDPFTPSWGEPYLQIAHRMLAAANKARVEAAGREAVLVSHQLPVWTLRRFLQGQRLWHDPRNRQCSLASITSLVYQGDTLIDIVYSEPAGASDPKVTGA